MKLILASSSTGRRKLLTTLKVPFEIVPSNTDEETILRSNPKDTIRLRAKAKAEEIFKKYKGQDVLILAADSMVILDGKTIGKPVYKSEAVSMLKHLSGTTHNFTTAFYMISGKFGEIYKGDETSTITFAQMSDEEIDLYLSIDDYTKYAGAYSLFDSPQWFVKEVKGSISNIVGLPLEKVIPILKKEGIL